MRLIAAEYPPRIEPLGARFLCGSCCTLSPLRKSVGRRRSWSRHFGQVRQEVGCHRGTPVPDSVFVWRPTSRSVGLAGAPVTSTATCSMLRSVNVA